MQFREQGNRIQVLAYRSYNKEKKRAEVKLLGSFSKVQPFEPSEKLIDALTDDEKKELQSYQETMRQSQDARTRQVSIYLMLQWMKKASDSLADPESASKVTEKIAADIYSAMDDLAKGLRKLGHKRPSKASTAASE